MMKQTIRTRATLMPARRAASGLPPTAKTCRPKRVRSRTDCPIHRMPSAIGTTIGTPWIGNTPVERSWLSRYTMKPPATIQAPTRIHSRAIGRVATPAACRRRRS